MPCTLGSWVRREARGDKFICLAASHHHHQLIQYNSCNPKSSALGVHAPQDLRAVLVEAEPFPHQSGPAPEQIPHGHCRWSQVEVTPPKTMIWPKEPSRLLQAAGEPAPCLAPAG